MAGWTINSDGTPRQRCSAARRPHGLQPGELRRERQVERIRERIGARLERARREWHQVKCEQPISSRMTLRAVVRRRLVTAVVLRGRGGRPQSPPVGDKPSLMTFREVPSLSLHSPPPAAFTSSRCILWHYTASLFAQLRCLAAGPRSLGAWGGGWQVETVFHEFGHALQHMLTTQVLQFPHQPVGHPGLRQRGACTLRAQRLLRLTRNRWVVQQLDNLATAARAAGRTSVGEEE